MSYETHHRFADLCPIREKRQLLTRGIERDRLMVFFQCGEEELFPVSREILSSKTSCLSSKCNLLIGKWFLSTTAYKLRFARGESVPRLEFRMRITLCVYPSLASNTTAYELLFRHFVKFSLLPPRGWHNSLDSMPWKIVTITETFCTISQVDNFPPLNINMLFYK